ncbi:MAG: 4-hydroxy-tetrahydrodipicolinate synthase [Thermomicrobiales bacterium]|nr:4-hydroxy-tetrahydrodipicolinate synthase [Thermomicrobiales bacterium]
MAAYTTPTTPRFTGAFTALITPFRSGEIDEPALRNVVEFQIRGGIDGLIPCGTTGESVTMTDFEHDRVIEIVVDQTAGRVPVIAGTGTNNTRATIEHTRYARAAGAAGALVVVPYYNKPTQEGMYRHYAAIAEATDLPLVLYNVPGRTGVNMTPETVLRLATIPSIAGIKEASGNLDQVSQIAIEARPDFAVLSGDDSLTLPIMSVGGHGVVSVVSNIVPDAVASLTGACLRGDFAAARTTHQRLFDLCRAMFIENNPTAVKTAAGILGLCSGELRLPLTAMAETNRLQLEAALQLWGFSQLMATAAD